MKKRRYILLFASMIVIAACVGLYMYYKPHKDFGNSSPDYILTAKDLFGAFDTDEAEANQRFVADDKTILVSGTLDEIMKNPDSTSNVVLRDSGMTGSISCSLVRNEIDEVAVLKKGNKLRIKGQCTGVQELLDKQVIMIRCVIDN